MDEDGDHLVNFQEPETWRWAGSDVPIVAACVRAETLPRWWFQIFFMFIPTWGNDPI